ncbi:MAG: hypothetical protein M3R51_09050 [Candidatus Eremiobacteraeota bacterium]|nr:hypothetical protein [Candidatus Eremiobacteraeota bacterium]
MKLPYRAGTWVEVPLGDGSFVRACIMRADHHTVDIAAYEDVEAGPVAVLRVSDGALVLHRWCSVPAPHRVAEHAVENTRWIGAALSERRIAARLRRLPFIERSIGVRDMRDGGEPDGSLLTWGRPLDAPTLLRIERYVRERPATAIRLYGTAVSQLAHIAAWPIAHLRVAGEVSGIIMESVRELHLETTVDIGAAVACAPNVSTLRIATRDAILDARTIAQCGITLLDCSGLKRLLHLNALPSLRALRLARIAEEPALDVPHLRALCIDEVAITSLDALHEMPELQQLDLRGLWQLSIQDARSLRSFPQLIRCWVDIGGRRKNIEIYREARWAYPWPFEFIARLNDRIPALLASKTNADPTGAL